MNDTIQGVRALGTAEQRAVEGGVLPGGCIDPALQRLLDILNGTATP